MGTAVCALMPDAIIYKGLPKTASVVTPRHELRRGLQPSEHRALLVAGAAVALAAGVAVGAVHHGAVSLQSRIRVGARHLFSGFASLIFDGATVEVEDRRQDCGERRMVAIGVADDFHLTVLYTDRVTANRTARRIISARRSNRRERQIYRTAPIQGDKA